MPDQTNPITAALDRSFDRFASKFGIDTKVVSNPEVSDKIGTTKESSVAANPAIKTASEQGGSQNETQNDAGDYSTAAQELAKQKAEVKEHAKDGTDAGGSQNQSMKTDDKSYPVSGSIRLAMDALKELAVEDPRSAARLLHVAAEGAPDQNLGAPLGGEPNSVKAGEEEEKAGPATPAAGAQPDETPGGNGSAMDSMVAGEIQKKLNDLAEEKKIDQEVMNQLSDVLKGVGVSTAAAKKAVETMAKRAIAMASLKSIKTSAADSKAPPTDEQSKKVPHASQDVKSDQYKLADGDPDESLRQQANGASKEKTESHSGQEFAASGDESYKLGWAAYDAIGGGKTMAEKTDPKKPLTAKERFAALREKRAAATVNGRPLSTKKAESPKERGEAAGGPETNNYESALQGDVKDDELADGNRKALESPETAAVVSQMQSEMDKRHNESVRGSTVASTFSKEERTAIVGKLAAIDEVYSTVVKLTQAASKVPAHEKRAALSQALGLLRPFKSARDSVRLAAAAKPTKEARARFVQALSAVAPIVKQAKREAVYLDALIGTEQRGIKRLARTAPALKLALHQVQLGHIELANAPVKLAEYVKMDEGQFLAVARTVQEIGQINRGQAPRGMQRTAQRLPSVVSGVAGNGLKDELEGCFDD